MDIGRMTSAGEPDGKSQEHEKPTYKSFKKKYRKMRIQFEQKMAENQQNYKAEDRAAETARRLAIENDRLLDLLLDVNFTPQVPPSMRFDLTMRTPSLPDLIPVELYQSPTPEGQEIYESIRGIVEQRARAKAQLELVRPEKSLQDLLARHPPLPIEALPEQQRSELKHPLTFLTSDQLDEATSTMDQILGLEVHPALQKPDAFPRKFSDKELETQNPSSVYSWLRYNEPQVFLQDSEDATATGKTGSSRGAGKRASVATPAALKAEALALPLLEDEEMDSEGQFVTPTTNKSIKVSKRKRITEEDVGYRPKGGSRPSKKKKSEGSTSRKSGGASKAKRGERAEGPGELVLDMAE